MPSAPEQGPEESEVPLFDLVSGNYIVHACTVYCMTYWQQCLLARLLWGPNPPFGQRVGVQSNSVEPSHRRRMLTQMLMTRTTNM